MTKAGVGLAGASGTTTIVAPASRLRRTFHNLVDYRNMAQVLLGAILVSALFVFVVLTLEALSGWGHAPFHTIASIALILIVAAVLVSYRVLRRRITETALELQQIENLRLGKAAADTAILTKERFLANVSHEIRSPLNAIYGYAQLIEQEARINPKEAARIIRRCAEHMTSLVDSLLDITRAEQGIFKVRSEVVRLQDFIDQIVWMMRPSAQAKGLDFVYEQAGWLPEYVRTDQNRFRQVLINLLSNAIKFTETGCVKFRVSYRSQIATFEIIDTGPGIASADQERIFAPYERLDVGQPERPGIGLGLTITKAIVDILGGALELESVPGSGTCFRVIAMLGEVTDLQAPAAAQRRIAGYDGPRRSVVLVDDDPEQRSFLEHFLVASGFDVVAVSNGETAVRLSELHSFDLAILDISLPGISGWETAVQLRERVQGDLSVIMASANAHEFQRPDHENPVHDHFFVKPYSLNQMAEVIGALLHLSWKWEAIGEAPRGEAPEGALGLPEAARPHVAQLKDLIRIGHVRGIEAEIGMIDKLVPEGSGAVRKLYAALDEFDLAGMAKMLEEL